MAFKNVSKLSSRNQSSLVSQIHKLIKYYSRLFSLRDRIYIKKLSQTDGNIYWLENKEKELISVALVEPDHILDFYGFKLLPLGYTISKLPGQMENILHHVLSDYKNQSLCMCTRPSLASSLNLETVETLEITPSDLEDLKKDLGPEKEILTNYFNIQNESLISALQAKKQHLYIKLSEEDKKPFLDKFPSLKDKYNHIKEA